MKKICFDKTLVGVLTICLFVLASCGKKIATSDSDTPQKNAEVSGMVKSPASKSIGLVPPVPLPAGTTPIAGAAVTATALNTLLKGEVTDNLVTVDLVVNGENGYVTVYIKPTQELATIPVTASLSTDGKELILSPSGSKQCLIDNSTPAGDTVATDVANQGASCAIDSKALAYLNAMANALTPHPVAVVNGAVTVGFVNPSNSKQVTMALHTGS